MQTLVCPQRHAFFIISINKQIFEYNKKIDSDFFEPQKYKNEETNKYNSSLFLKENTVDDWKLIQNAENIEFDGSVRNINAAILKHVATLLHDGFFDYYIARYEYELNCFDIGNEKMEKERLDKNNV